MTDDEVVQRILDAFNASFARAYEPTAAGLKSRSSEMFQNYVKCGRLLEEAFKDQPAQWTPGRQWI